jgi:hypothetical protein
MHTNTQNFKKTLDSKTICNKIMMKCGTSTPTKISLNITFYNQCWGGPPFRNKKGNDSYLGRTIRTKLICDIKVKQVHKCKHDSLNKDYIFDIISDLLNCYCKPSQKVPPTLVLKCYEAHITFLSQLEHHPCGRKWSVGHCRYMWH